MEKIKLKNAWLGYARFNPAYIIIYAILGMPLIIIIVKQKNIVYVILLIVMMLLTYFIAFLIKKKKNYVANDHIDYYRNIPEDIKPAIINALFDQKSVNSINGIVSTLMNLINKEYIKVFYDSDINLFYSSSEYEKDYLFILNKEKNINNLKKHEKFIIQWFFKTDIIKASELKNQFKKDNFTGARFENFNTYLMFDIQEEKLFQQYIYSPKESIILIIILCLLFFFSFNFLNNLYILIISIFINYSILSFLQNHDYILTKHGKDVINKFKNLKAYLLDFSNMDEKQFMEIKLWKEYITYATAFKISTTIEENFKKIFGLDLYNVRKSK